MTCCMPRHGNSYIMYILFYFFTESLFVTFTANAMLSVVRLAAHFTPDVDEEVLKDEYQDLQLMEDKELPTGPDDQPCRLDAVWSDILALKTPLGEPRFATLKRIMTPLLSLPHSNADCERAFSMVRKVHTEFRKALHADTITAYLQCKMNFDADCHQFDVTPAILRRAKHATVEYNQEHV